MHFNKMVHFSVILDSIIGYTIYGSMIYVGFRLDLTTTLKFEQTWG